MPNDRVRVLFVAIATAGVSLHLSAFYDLQRSFLSARGKLALTEMEIPRVTSPPSIHVNGFHNMTIPERPSSRSVTTSFHRGPRPMAIPNLAAEHFAPPALPPPRYIDEDAAGGDQATQWKNSLDSSSFESGGSVSSSSSLRGNWDRKMAVGRSAGRPDSTRRISLVSKLQSQPEVDTKYDFSRHVDEGYHSLSGSSLVNQSVQTFS